MNALWRKLLAAAVCLFALPAVHATITCTTITTPGITINYQNGTTTSVQTYFTVSCTRSSPSDPTSVNYDVSADNGNQPTGPNNRAKLGAALLRYDVFVDAGCTTQWKGARKISDTITWAASATGTITKQTSYWGCIVTAQTATSSGDYVDSVGLTLKYNGINISGSVPVNIYAPANCTVSTPAGNINLTYAAFGPQTSGSTSFAVTCTNSMPYTIATDATEGVLAGVRYTLTLSGTSSNGTGAPQPYTVTATIPAGQAGTCPAGSCTATRTHTLTITY